MNISIKQLTFYDENEALPGVRRVAGKVRRDVERVLSLLPGSVTSLKDASPCALIYGTVGHSPILDRLDQARVIDLSGIKGKREVFLFAVVKQPVEGMESALVIAGSDKRGTIYGLFHLSELMGVSPLVDWSDAAPLPRDDLLLDTSVNMVSREPSVKFRGLFINDEWPAFGNWSQKRFGGFNADMYDHLFELILRHKGNFFWPAMWTSSFSCDGPGLKSAELADEYGIVMGTSHHEPCIRNGEEYSHLRGPGSPYGDAWDFRANREGITRFWRDGLTRNKGLENIVTLGMRGERDSTILGKTAALSDNIDLLRDVIQTQNKLIQEEYNENLTETPRCLVMFTEVERFYHGDEETPGLGGDPCLDDVMLMLCDDNFGNVKSLPRGKMKDHKGGFGLYYHFDFHGGPTSYEWINSSYLPKMWEQLTLAYESGVREAWIVNVGDLALQEFPLSYYFAMAYDMDRYGAAAENNSEDFTAHWIRQTFGDAFDEKARQDLQYILQEYSRLNHNRKPEVASAGVYHPVHFNESYKVLETVDLITQKADALRALCPPALEAAFYELVYFPAVASANVQKLQVLAGQNAFFAAQNRVAANRIADEMEQCIRRDRDLTEELHTIDGGRWYGMGMSEHIGFRHWLEECNKYPVISRIVPANKPRILVSHHNGSQYTEGFPWTGKPLTFNDFLRPDKDTLTFDISCGSQMAVPYTLTCDAAWLEFSQTSGHVSDTDNITVRLDRAKLPGRATAIAMIQTENAKVQLRFEAETANLSGYKPMTFLERDGYIAMNAEHYAAKGDEDAAAFFTMSPYGRTEAAMAAKPLIKEFSAGHQPWLEYRFETAAEGAYELDLYLSPTNPLFFGSSIELDISVNQGDSQRENTTGANFQAHNFACKPWVQGVTDNIRIHKTTVTLAKGINSLRIYAVNPGMALERLLLHPKGKRPPESYLGPTESFFVPCYTV